MGETRGIEKILLRPAAEGAMYVDANSHRLALLFFCGQRGENRRDMHKELLFFMMVFPVSFQSCTTARQEPAGALQIEFTNSKQTGSFGTYSMRRASSRRDGMWMVFVPEGSFLMGSDNGPDDETPSHIVWLDAFWIDQTEVTNAQFGQFIRESNYQTDAEASGWSYVYAMQSTKWVKVNGADWSHPGGPLSTLEGLEDLPVAYISWNDAMRYCQWANRRLPSEAEWEKAARGTDGRRYPWGDQNPDCHLLNYADKNITLSWADNKEDDGYAFTSPAGHYPLGASPYGALDMAGNVWEWVNDWYDPNYYHGQNLWINPPGPSTQSGRVLRGGSWADSAIVTRSTLRLGYYPMDGYAYYGFRCATSMI
jgi:formylglycine-generating enzyme required for sulfatase activity